MLVDNIGIEEISYFEDFEDGNGGWISAGFVRVQGKLPQSYRLAQISKGTETEVTYIELNDGNLADIPINIGDDVSEIVLVVMGNNQYTTQSADYSFKFIQ